VHMVGAVAAETMIRGFLGEGRHWLQRVLDVVHEPTPERAHMLWVDGWHALNQGDLTDGESRLEASRELAERLGDTRDATIATVFLGTTAMMRGDVAGAFRQYHDAFGRVRREDEPWSFVVAATRLGFASFLQGDVDRAVELCEAAIAESDKYGESWHKAEALADLSTILWRQGDTHRAAELALEALRIERAFDNAVGVARFLEILAWIAASERRHPRAARLLGAADGVWHAIDASLFPYLRAYRTETEQSTRRALGARTFDTDYRVGIRSLQADNVAFALDEPEETVAPAELGEAGSLTRREREIADLVVAGRTNREVAEQLVLSTRTIEAHLRNIYAKLGVRSRIELARAIERAPRSVA
jgi:DNA-binding NarL/FixJ family response regulator